MLKHELYKNVYKYSGTAYIRTKTGHMVEVISIINSIDIIIKDIGANLYLIPHICYFFKIKPYNIHFLCVCFHIDDIYTINEQNRIHYFTITRRIYFLTILEHHK